MLTNKRFKPSDDDWKSSDSKSDICVTNNNTTCDHRKRKSNENLLKRRSQFKKSSSHLRIQVAMGTSGSKIMNSDSKLSNDKLVYKTESEDLSSNNYPGYVSDHLQPRMGKMAVHDEDGIRPQKRLLVGSQPIGSSSMKHIQNTDHSKIFDVMSLKIQKLKFGIDKHVTQIDERSSAVLKYRTPHFRALATVEVPPLDSDENIQIGWVQVCNEMHFINKYGNEGLTSWEFPEIVSGKYRMVSDADGRQYPWYGSKNEVATLQGPTSSPIAVTVQMNDNFFPQVTWYIPHTSYAKEPSLTFVYRKQNFYTYLALKNLNIGSYQVLKTITWSMELAIEVNPSNTLGKRAKLLGPFEQEPSKIVTDYNISYPEKYALSPPNANNSQVLIWRPRVGDASVVVPPVQTTMDINKYLQSSRDLSEKLYRLARSRQAEYSGK